MSNTFTVMGMWKFRDSVGLAPLVALANAWKTDPAYTQLYIRPCSKDQLGLGFTYVSASPDPQIDSRGFKSLYCDRVSDQLRRQFGNDMVGWDMAAGDHVVTIL